MSPIANFTDFGVSTDREHERTANPHRGQTAAAKSKVRLVETCCLPVERTDGPIHPDRWRGREPNRLFNLTYERRDRPTRQGLDEPENCRKMRLPKALYAGKAYGNRSDLTKVRAVLISEIIANSLISLWNIRWVDRRARSALTFKRGLNFCV